MYLGTNLSKDGGCVEDVSLRITAVMASLNIGTAEAIESFHVSRGVSHAVQLSDLDLAHSIKATDPSFRNKTLEQTPPDLLQVANDERLRALFTCMSGRSPCCCQKAEIVVRPCTPTYHIAEDDPPRRSKIIVFSR